MSENTKTTDVGDNTTESVEGFAPITSQEDFDKAISSRIQREKQKYADYDELKAKADQVDKVQDESKSETERLQEQLTRIQSERDQEKTENARLAAIAHEGIPTDYQDLVQGSDPDSFAASAKKVKDLLGKTETAKPTVEYKVNLDGAGEPLALNSDGLAQSVMQKLGVQR